MSTQEPEIWKDVAGYEGSYEVSSLGRVRSLKRVVALGNGLNRRIRSRILKLNKGGSGYYTVSLRDGSQRTVNVHQIVAVAFLGERKDGLDINHINGIKTDNRVKNLEYISRTKNIHHALKVGLMRVKLTPEDVRNIRERVQAGSRKALAKEFGVTRQTIGHIVRGKTWTCIEAKGRRRIDRL